MKKRKKIVLFEYLHSGNYSQFVENNNREKEG